MGLPLEYSYNLNAVTEVTTTESFLSLKENVRSCHEKHSYGDCITRKYLEEYKNKCKCLPFRLGLSDEVDISINKRCFKFKNLLSSPSPSPVQSSPSRRTRVESMVPTAHHHRKLFKMSVNGIYIQSRVKRFCLIL